MFWNLQWSALSPIPHGMYDLLYLGDFNMVQVFVYPFRCGCILYTYARHCHAHMFQVPSVQWHRSLQDMLAH
jgi:hypothetical protein